MVIQIDPQLAYKLPIGEKGEALIKTLIEDPRWICEEKYDGSRYLGHMFKTCTTYTSRRISDVTHKLCETTGGKLEHLNFKLKTMSETIFDAEYMSTAASSLTKASLNIFDILYYKGHNIMSETLEIRNKWRKKAVKEILQFVPNAQLFNVPNFPAKDAQKHFDEIISSGGEGIIFKNLDAPYIPGSRARTGFVKWKKKKTYDVIVRGHKKSNSAKYGLKGLNTFRHLLAWQYDKEKNLILVSHVPATSWTDEQHKMLADMGIDNLDGKIIEVEAMERASGGIKLRHPRFIRFRDDKNPEECIIN